MEEKRISRAPPSEISELTEFSDPWNEVCNGVVTNDVINTKFSSNLLRLTKINCFQSEETSDEYKSIQKTASINRTKSFKDRLDPLLCKYGH